MPDYIVRLGGRDRELFEMLTDSLHDIDNHLSRIASSQERMEQTYEAQVQPFKPLTEAFAKKVPNILKDLIEHEDGPVRAATDPAPAAKKQP